MESSVEAIEYEKAGPCCSVCFVLLKSHQSIKRTYSLFQQAAGNMSMPPFIARDYVYSSPYLPLPSLTSSFTAFLCALRYERVCMQPIPFRVDNKNNVRDAL